MTLSSNDR